MAESILNADFNGLTQAEPTIPSQFYFDPAHHKRELDALWYRQWLYVCRSEGLSESGDWKTFQIGNQNLLIVRGTDGELRAFHNTCRHRGSILCDGDDGRFKSKLITCPYHQWSYAFDGKLISTTSHAEGENFQKNDYPLYRVGLMEWRGCIMVCPAGEQHAADFTSAFMRESGRLDNWPLEELKVAHTWTKVMSCNWKVFWENFNECLHCPNIHPELSELVPLYSRRIFDPKDTPHWHEHADSNDPKYMGGLREGAETWSRDGTLQATPFPSLTERERTAGQTTIVSLPSTFLSAHADHVRIVRLRPLGPEETELQAEWLVTADAMDDPSFDIMALADFPILVMDQDAAACELNQRGLHSLAHEAGVLMPEEYYLHTFHNWVRDGLAKP